MMWDYSESNFTDIRRNTLNSSMSSSMVYHQNGAVENDFVSFPPSGNSSKPPKSKTACKFFLAGKCSFGGRCQFSHVIPGSAGNNENSLEYCSFYRAGHCKYGNSCSMKHGNPSSNDSSLGMLTASMQDLDFESEQMAPRCSEGGRNSLLPSFLVDELLLDDDEDEDVHHQTVSAPKFPQLTRNSLFSNINETSEPIIFFERERSSSVTPVKSKAPASYGEAIASGLNPASFNAEPYLGPDYEEYDDYEQQDEKYADELCAFSIMGKCRYGSFCRNVHGLQCPRCLLYVLHPTDMERNEDHLNECLSKPESAPIAQLHQIQCGLCLSPVLQGVDPRFGLLNCNHAFCLGCIRNWRATHFDANNENPRSCPDCKEVTYFIVPSSTWIDDQIEKFKVIEQYKKRMSVIPCKYFDYGRGDCPFGTSCFYEHRVETSADSKYPRAPIILDHREQIAKVRDAKLSDYIVFKTAPARNKKK